MPQFSAPEAYAVFREFHLQIPYIIVSGEIGEDIAVESLKFGADDYLLKHNLRRLIPALQRALKDAETRRQRDAARERNEQIMANSLDMICTLDGKSCFVEVSEASKRILGLAPAEMEGKKHSEFLVPEDQSNTEQEMQKIMAGRATVSFENHYYHKNGSIVNLMWSAHWSEKEKLMFCVARDVTEKKRLEEQFLRAQRMESIGTMASGIAHDLNNVLAPILMSLSILDGQNTGDENRELFAGLTANTRRAADIISQMLAFGRGLQGERIKVEPKNLLKEAANIVKETFPKSIQFSLEIAPGLWNVTDRSQKVYI